MNRRLAILAAVLVAVAAAALGGATFAFGGGSLIWDDGHFARPGALDDGKDLLPQATITLAQANAAALRATSGALGQVDLERHNGRVVYKVDVGDKEVRVDAGDGTIASIAPQE
jgi:uncharacterized membrane protein YkoI